MLSQWPWVFDAMVCRAYVSEVVGGRAESDDGARWPPTTYFAPQTSQMELDHPPFDAIILGCGLPESIAAA